MSPIWPIIVYLLCLLSSLVCAVLLFRAWWLNRSALLLWTAISFGFLAINNLGLVVDLVIFPQISLWPIRIVPVLIALIVLLYGFVWETDR